MARWLAVLVVAAGLAAGLVGVPAGAFEPENAGRRRASDRLPFRVETVARFESPWAVVFLDDRRMLVTEKPGALWLVTANGAKTRVSGVPPVAYGGQNGLLDIAPAPDFARSGLVYLTYVEPGTGGGGLALARARLAGPALDNLSVLWRQLPKGGGGQPGGIVAFAPDGQSLFLTVGERQRLTPAQDPATALGKLLHLSLDGAAMPDNPAAGEGGDRARVWTSGHRNPYGLAFAPDGRLWLHEMGPRGGDEFNLIERGKNYGWPEVSYGDHYGGAPIPRPPTRPEFQGAELFWNPVIAPAGLIFYQGTLFPQWRGSALLGGLVAEALIRVSFDGDGHPREADRWNLRGRVRDVAEAPDGAVWVIEDEGRLMRLAP
jgi:aldose sugar dehydrogenase